MDVCMLLHVGFLMELFATLRAIIWSDVRVDQHVCCKSGRPFKNFVALHTLKKTMTMK